MPCYSPLRAFWTGGYTDSGKKDFIIGKRKDNELSLESCMKVYPNHHYDYHNLKMLYGHYWLTDPIDVPCGHCIGCRLSYSKTWAQRCMLEARTSENNWFVTLTYDDDHLPDDLSVQKKVLSDFLKRLRAEVKYHFGVDGVRFYGCGEYGDQFGRPHYHVILFNCPLCNDKFKLYNTKMNFRGDTFYQSSLIEKCWPYGFSYVGDVNWQTCAYVSRYVMKKINGPKVDELDGRQVPFVLMSRCPGIAKDYYDTHKDKIYENDEILMMTTKKGKPTLMTLKPSRYYDKLYDIDNPEKFKKIHDHRMVVASIIEEDKLNSYNQFSDKFEMLSFEQEIKLEHLKHLRR